MNQIPYRLDIAGSWGSHPFINALCPQIQIIARIEGECIKRGMGLAGSSRDVIINNPGLTDKELYDKENEGKSFMVGSEDIVGILKPGIKIFHYDSSYWMDEKKTEYLPQKDIDWLNEVLHLIQTYERPKNLNVLGELNVTRKKAEEYRKSTYRILKTIRKHNLKAFAEEIINNHNILISMMPRREIDIYYNWGIGRKLCGAGGGGYVLAVSDKKITNEDEFKII